MPAPSRKIRPKISRRNREKFDRHCYDVGRHAPPPCRTSRIAPSRSLPEASLVAATVGPLSSDFPPNHSATALLVQLVEAQGLRGQWPVGELQDGLNFVLHYV